MSVDTLEKIDKTGSRWSDDEIKQLLEEVSRGISVSDITKIHNRSYGGVSLKLLGIANFLIEVMNKDIVEACKIVGQPIHAYVDYKSKNKQAASKNDKRTVLHKLFDPHPEDLLAIKKTRKVSPKLDSVSAVENKPLNSDISIVLNTEQELAVDAFMSGENVFITGPAGTGKSVTLRKIISSLTQNERKFGVTSTTGNSAILIGGKTLHSYLGIGLAKDSAEDIFRFVRYKLSHVAKKLREIDTLIIDEISMLDAELFDKISRYLCLLRKSDKPFGGIQLILTGDFCQLEPVVGDYCFKASEWSRLNLKVIKLQQQIRQDGDSEFQEILSKLRYGRCDDTILTRLKSLKDTDFNGVIPTILYSKNVDVDTINRVEYLKLLSTGVETKRYSYINHGTSSDKPKIVNWANSLNIPELIELCVDSQVLVTANIDQKSGIVNGTRGVVVELKPKSVVIKLVSGSLYEVGYYKNTLVEDPDIALSFMPLKLAYALTIHKSQGMTLDAIEIDIGHNIFASGQAYTAISRAKNLKSVRVNSVLKSSFITDPDVLQFYGEI
jgi:ATP-dependent DNA helicase PIF1